METVITMNGILKDTGTPFTETDVLVVTMSNRPGSLARVCEKLANGHINVDYAYCSTGAQGGKTLGIFKVAHVEKAIKILGPMEANATTNHKKKAPHLRRKVSTLRR